MNMCWSIGFRSVQCYIWVLWKKSVLIVMGYTLCLPVCQMAGEKERSSQSSRHPLCHAAVISKEERWLWCMPCTWIVKILEGLRLCGVVKPCDVEPHRNVNLNLTLQEMYCSTIVQCAPAGISLKKYTCICSAGAKASQLHCVFMSNSHKRKQHLLYKRHNLNLLINLYKTQVFRWCADAYIWNFHLQKCSRMVLEWK